MYAFGRTISKLARPMLNITRNFQVSVLGASQPLGQSISMLLKQHPLIHRLTMHGAPEETCGIAMNLSHVPQEALIDGWTGKIEGALKSADIVVVANGQPKQAEQSEQDQFKKNADSVIRAMQEIVTHCPSAFVAIATDPINQTVPLAAKVLEAGNCFNKNKLFGVTGLNTMRAQTWVGGMYQIPPYFVKVPVICGNSPKTAVPLFSRIIPKFRMNDHVARFLTESIRSDDHKVADLKGGDENCTLSSAFATFCTVSAILNAMNGYAVEHSAFVANNDYGTKFFAAPVILTGQGITAMMQYKMVTALEAEYISKAVEQLSNDIEDGESYFNKYYQKTERANITLNCIKTL